MGDSAVLITHVRPSLLGTYGDRGNAIVLRERLTRRGIAAEILELEGPQPVPRSTDLVVIGGGEDDAQTMASTDDALAASLRAAVAEGATVLAVCAGFQLLGEHFLVGGGDQIAGYGLLDCWSDRLAARAVGEIVATTTEPGVGLLTGFENHRGRTVLGPSATPLGRVVTGVGNGDAGVEGAVQDRIVATYLHGPALARNPGLADSLLERVVGPLEPLASDLVDRLRDERLTAASAAPAGRSWRSLLQRQGRF